MDFNLAGDDKTEDVSGPQMDLWGEGEGGFDGQSTAPPEFVTEGAQEAGPKKGGNGLAIVLLLFIGIGVVYVYADDIFPDGNPFDELIAMIAGDDDFDLSNQMMSSRTVEPKRSPKASRRAPIDESNAPLNPYWTLPNHLVGEQMPMTRVWTALEEDNWRAGLENRFNYQRYRTVLEVRDMRLAGSEAILWEALNEPKLWIRMRAAMALADFGFELSLDTVERALGNASNNLIAKYFKRFRFDSTQGERFIMRQAIRLIDERGRLIVLKALIEHPSKLRDLYMVAGQYDPGLKLKKWLSRHRPEITPLAFNNLRLIVLGKRKYETSESSSFESMAEEQGDDNLELLNISNVEIYNNEAIEFNNVEDASASFDDDFDDGERVVLDDSAMIDDGTLNQGGATANADFDDSEDLEGAGSEMMISGEEEEF